RSALADEILHAAGAILGGRRWYDVAVRKFDGYDGIYGGQWKGPVFVLSPRPPDAEPHPPVTFISGTVSEAVATAKDAAAGKAVVICGANLAAQCLRGGLVDEIAIHLAPVRLEFQILSLNPGLGNVASRPMSDLRCLAHDEP